MTDHMPQIVVGLFEIMALLNTWNMLKHMQKSVLNILSLNKVSKNRGFILTRCLTVLNRKN